MVESWRANIESRFPVCGCVCVCAVRPARILALIDREKPGVFCARGRAWIRDVMGKARTCVRFHFRCAPRLEHVATVMDEVGAVVIRSGGMTIFRFSSMRSLIMTRLY